MSDSERITKLETHFEYVRRDLDDLKTGQDRILTKLDDLGKSTAALPSKTDLRFWMLQWIAICIMAIALIVGGIVGGLGWIQAGAFTPPPSQAQAE